MLIGVVGKANCTNSFQNLLVGFSGVNVIC